jgi:hypothetical protein
MNPRRSRYRVLSITLALAAVCAPSLAQDGVALLHKMQQALGGADKIAAVRDFDETVSAQTFNAQGAPTGATVRKRMRWIRPNILRPGPRLIDQPVYVLTSHQTFSGGEEFTFDLQTQKRATIVGETTGGGATLCEVCLPVTISLLASPLVGPSTLSRTATGKEKVLSQM